ncbi:CBS and ACT domain-containing protein [Alkalicoccus luteus]|uniref:CBS domain-containing protein n=1 Tax=Alkalicoccus luteus TaxID=1237094 RepID=A0A969PRA9_9BACI|nr:CBS and ACT domain-containing protein [Alkalicoccus luteus]NJP36976.1 CBS domain-containing protein [Alkalicoccus luteus]
MKIEEVMQKNVITITTDESVTVAAAKMKKHDVRHLPVVDVDGIEGVLSNRDVRGAESGSVSDYMTRNVHTCLPGDFVEDAAHQMLENKIHCLPVVDPYENVIGILTDTDLLRTLVRLTGSDRPSSRVEVEVDDKSGKLAEVTTIAKEHAQNIRSIFVIPAEDGRMRIVMRLQTMNPGRFAQALKENGCELIWPEEPEMTL